MKRDGYVCIFAIAALLLPPGSAGAQNAPRPPVLWSSGTSTVWADNANWSTGKVPAPADAVWILGNPQGDCPDAASGPTLAADVSIATLDLGPCAKVTISGATLTVTDRLGLHRGSTIVLQGSAHLKLSQTSTTLVVATTAALTPSGGHQNAVGAAAIAAVLLPDLGFTASGISTSHDPHSGEISVTFVKGDSSTPPSLSTANTRMTVGIEETAASSSSVSSLALVDLMVTAPILSRSSFKKLPGGAIDGRSFPLLLGWLDARLSGVPQQGAPGVKALVGGFENGIVTPDSNQTVQGIGVAGGVEIKLANGPKFGDDGHYQFEPTLMIGIGAQTPFVPSTAAPVFVLTDAAKQRYQVPDAIPNCTGTDCQFKYLAFLQPDRSRFLRQYFVGLRLKSHHFDCPAANKNCGEHERTEVNYPGTIDVMFGQDEAVSGGEFHHAILRLGAFYPLPFDTVANTFYIFGNMTVAITGNHTGQALILATPSTAVDVSDPHVFNHSLTAGEMDRDYWRLGLAVDLISLSKWLAPKQSGGSK